VIVVAGHQHDLAVAAERGAELLEERPRMREGDPQRALPQLDRVPEQDDAADPVERLQQRLAQLLPAQQVVAGGGAEMEVRDDERGSQGVRARQRGRVRRTAPPSPGGSASAA
jgi:hypothetical protein